MPTLHRNNQTYIPSSIRNGVPFSPKWIETLVATCKADDLLNNLMVMEVNIKYLLCVSDGTRHGNCWNKSYGHFCGMDKGAVALSKSLEG